jgi:hypothetical protein
MACEFGKRWFLLLLVVIASLTCALRCWAAEADQVYYSQGETSYDADDPAGSREDAIADLEFQALKQAVEKLIGPLKTADFEDDLDAEILNQPTRYVRSRQIFAEDENAGQYRVTGQVVLDMETLKADLHRLGALPADAGAEVPRPPDVTAAPKQGAASIETSGEARKDPPRPEYLEPAESTKGPLRGQTVLWLVAEKWEQEDPWHLPLKPELGTAAQALFANSVRHESQEYEWVLDLPDANPESADNASELQLTGAVSLDQATSLAARRNSRALVTGTATQKRQGDGKVSLIADLEIYAAPAAQWIGQVHRELTLTNLENASDYAEGVVQLGALVAPQLDRLVRGGLTSTGAVTTKESAGGSTAQARESWTLIIRSYHSPADWEQLEQALRREFKQLEVSAVELGAGNARVQLNHAPGGLGSFLKNVQLSKIRVQVLQEEPAVQTLHIAFSPLESTQ